MNIVYYAKLPDGRIPEDYLTAFKKMFPDGKFEDYLEDNDEDNGEDNDVGGCSWTYVGLIDNIITVFDGCPENRLCSLVDYGKEPVNQNNTEQDSEPSFYLDDGSLNIEALKNGTYYVHIENTLRNSSYAYVAGDTLLYFSPKEDGTTIVQGWDSIAEVADDITKVCSFVCEGGYYPDEENTAVWDYHAKLSLEGLQQQKCNIESKIKELKKEFK